MKAYAKHAKLREGMEDDDDTLIDPKCKTFKEFEIGQLVFQEDCFAHNEYTEQVVLGFSCLLLKGNKFASPEDRKHGTRRVIVGYMYEGKMNVCSQPLHLMCSMPVEKPIPKCVYCKRRPVNKLNCGACNNALCVRESMREHL